MEKYVCDGECGGVSNHPGRCNDVSCSKYGKPLRKVSGKNTSSIGQNFSIVSVFFGLFFFIFAFVWMQFVGPILIALPDDFSYRADVISFDNFYSEDEGDFLGPQRSITTFSYRTLDMEEGVLTVQNDFDVYTPEGEQIVLIERTYRIDSLTGAHTGTDAFGRTGSLFAPRNLKEGDSYQYWHVNYNDPITMEFVDSGVVNGLPVFHYAADFTTIQTAELTHLPGVPEERGVELDVHIETWIEPTTGHLVNYQDNTTAYFTNNQTDDRIHPWNQFTNTFSPSSVIFHTEEAQKIKNQEFVATKGVPIGFVIVGVLFLLFGVLQKIFIRFIAHIPSFGAILILLLLGALGFGALSFADLPQQKHVTVGMALLFGSPDSEGVDVRGFKESLLAEGFEEGKDITYEFAYADGDIDVHKQNVRTFAEKEVDLLYTHTTPGTLAVKEVTNSIPTVFTLVVYPRQVGIIEADDRSKNNFVGVRYHIPLVTQFFIFEQLYDKVDRLIFVQEKDELVGDTQFIEFKKVFDELDISYVNISVENPGELSVQLGEVLTKGDAVYLACGSAIQTIANPVLVELTLAAGVPIFACAPNIVSSGGLVSVYPDSYDIGFAAGKKAAAILGSGAQPSDLKTSVPSNYLITLNESTLRSLGLTIPSALEDQISEIIK